MMDKKNLDEIIVDEIAPFDHAEYEKIMAYMTKTLKVRSTGGAVKLKPIWFITSPGPEIINGGQSGKVVPRDKSKDVTDGNLT